MVRPFSASSGFSGPGPGSDPTGTISALARTPFAGETRSGRASEILDSAAALLEQEGREALTMRRLAERIGIRASSLYKHFTGKEEIEEALVERGVERLRAGLADARRKPDPVEAVVAELVRFAAAHPHLFALLAERHPAPRLADDPRERALLVFAQGMSLLESSGTLAPAEAVHVWNQGRAAFRALAAPVAPRTVVSSIRGPD